MVPSGSRSATAAPDVRMPGFRPGKVPANLVKKMHGPQLHQEALNTSVREAIDKAIWSKATYAAKSA